MIMSKYPDKGHDQDQGQGDIVSASFIPKSKDHRPEQIKMLFDAQRPEVRGVPIQVPVKIFRVGYRCGP